MKSPRQQRNAARRARHRAAEATASFESSQATAQRQRDASDAARLARFEVQGRGFRPIFARTPLAAPIQEQTFQETALGGGSVDDDKVSMLAKEARTADRELGGGRRGR